MNLQQSVLYRRYIQVLTWTVVTIDGVHVFIKRCPLFGGLAKIQRCSKLPDIKKLLPVLKEHRIRTLAIEPEYTVDQPRFQKWCVSLSHYTRLNSTPFLPTKTILIDLTLPEEKIFHRFSEAKRRAVRRAIKHKVIIKESTNIDDLIKIKNKSAGLLGFITTYGIKNLWRVFAPKQATILLAYDANILIGGILVL